MRCEAVPRVLPLLLVLLAAGPLAAGSDDKPWSAEVGTVVSHRDNFFFRSDDADTPSPSATLTTLYANAEWQLEARRGRWKFGGGVAGTFTRDIDDADSQHGRATVQYKRRSTRASLRYAHLPNRLYSEDADGTFFDLSALTFEVRQGLTRGLWFGGEYEIENWRFDSEQPERDAEANQLSGTLRLPLGQRAGLRLTLSRAEKHAQGAQYDWTGTGRAVAVELRPSQRLSLFARYKRRDREFDGASADDANFLRDDTIVDALVNLRMMLGRVWGVRTQLWRRDGESTRDDRNYTANELSFALFFAL